MNNSLMLSHFSKSMHLKMSIFSKDVIMNLRTPFLLAAILLIAQGMNAQVRLKYFINDTEIDIQDKKPVSVSKELTELKTIKVRSSLATGHKLEFDVNGEKATLKGTAPADISFTNDLLNETIVVKHFRADGTEVVADAISFTIVADAEEQEDVVLDIKVQITNAENTQEFVSVVNDQDIIVPANATDYKKLKIRCANLPKDHSLIVGTSREEKKITNDRKTELTFSENLIDKEILIRHFDAAENEIQGDRIRFRIVREEDAGGEDEGGNNTQRVSVGINEYMQRYATYTPTPFGYIDPNEKEPIVHIFFDHFGNNLLSTVPQGISNAQYVIHIIYPFKSGDDLRFSYSVKQKTGSFNSALMFNNTNVRTQLPGGSLQSDRGYDGITERTFLLGTASDDLAFDIVLAEKGKSAKTVLESYTIKMSPVYHGSFDIGLLRTDLSSPTFELVDLPGATNGEKVVKQTDQAPRGVVTIMVSFYTSPVIWLESLANRTKFGKKKIPFYKMTGRSFLDDHKIYERIYPTIGVSISDKAFENLFFGFNWEIARGLSLFGGWHYGKVNTFTKPDFVPSETLVTPAEFEFYQTTKWKTSGAIGVKLDAMILKNLFGN